MFVPKNTPKKRKIIELIQGSPGQGGFQLGYQSLVTESRTSLKALSDMTNADLDQDNLPRPRPSLVLFGSQPLGPIIGIGTFIKIVSGVPEKWDISMQVIGSVGKIHVRKDGGDWVVAGGTNSYNKDAIVNFCQSGNKVFVSNATDYMSFYTISTGNVTFYSSLATPSAPSLAQTGMAGTDFTYYYRISANNDVGESTASVQASIQTNTMRDIASWSASKYITVTWSAVTGATSYNIYVGTQSGEEKYLATVTSLKYVDDGQTAFNAFKIAPGDNSTQGPRLTSMINKDGQLLGVGDADNPDRLWYDAGVTGVGDFSPFNGGGWVGINSGGDTTPQAVKTFRTGRGEPAITVLSRGIAGAGKMHHVIFTTTTFDNQVISIPNVQEAQGQGGTVSARAVLEANNSLWYPTGQDFKSTGTSANIQNILSTNSVSTDILPDVRKLNLSAMHKACGLVYENRLYWALPVGSSENNEIWIKDLSRKGIWILRWTIPAKFMWLSENNTTGQIDFCIYDGTNILAFSRSVMTQDNGVPFKTRVAHEGIVWSDSGMTMGAIQELKAKLMQPAGTINIKTFGLDEDGESTTLAVEPFTQTSSFTGWNQLDWFNDEWSGDIGEVNFTSTQVKIMTLEIGETLNELGWSIETDTTGCDYYLSSVLIKGIEVPSAYLGD